MNSLKYSLVIALFSFILIPNSQAQLFSSLNKLQNAPLHAGNSRSFEHDFNDVLKAARESIVESGLVMESANKIDDETFMMIGKTKVGGMSWGELVRVTVIKDSNKKSTVWVYSQRRVKMNIAAKGDYSNTILSNLDMKLNL